jgi:acyl-CoA reductase-like NAD-dependent aldehyde dehydrogenase
MSDHTTNQEEKEFTPEEMAQQRKNMIAYYKDQEQYLSVVLRHEELKASISKARAERVMYDIRVAQMMAGPQEEETDGTNMEPETNEEPQEKKARTLKKNQ